MNVKHCCGCSACAAVCPKRAIKMTQNNKGFYVPNVDAKLCVNCGACEKVCPQINQEKKKATFQPVAYAYRNKDLRIVKNSSSGGIFWSLGQKIIDCSGVVYGCAWSGDLKAQHVRVTTIDELKRLQKSKYVQSDLNDTFRSVRNDLDKGKPVLFSGTPCQIAGLYRFLKLNYEKLVTVDIICHGVPSAKVLKTYITYCEEKLGSKITSIDFRNKDNGWIDLSLKMSFEKRESVLRKASDDPYYRAFLSNLSLSDACGCCSFNCIPRQSDITMGDYWGYKNPKYHENLGVSCVVVNTEKGRILIETVTSPEEREKTTIREIMVKNPFLDGHCKLHPRREQFFEKLEQMNFEENVIEALKPTRAETIAEITCYKAGQVLRKIKNLSVKTNMVIETRKRRRQLKHKDFTILSNNCWGGFVQQKYGLPYNSPTVGLYIPGDDFVRFCADWQNYMAKELNFIPWEEARLYPQIKDSAPYPVALLGDVEIYFMHYHSQAEAREKWERRKARINPDRMIFKLSQRECCGREDIERFMALPEAHKVCFAYDEVPGAVLIPELRGLVGDEQPLTEAYFDELEFLNRL